MDNKTIKKWDSAAQVYDLLAAIGTENRWQPYKTRLFSNMQGRILFLAIGTGLDIQFFPKKQTITAIDISPNMLKKAAKRANTYEGCLELKLQDVHGLDFPTEHFDQIYTSCTFCSVPEPIKGLKALHRVLKKQGQLFMFEHTKSRFFPYNGHSAVNITTKAYYFATNSNKMATSKKT